MFVTIGWIPIHARIDKGLRSREIFKDVPNPLSYLQSFDKKCSGTDIHRIHGSEQRPVSINNGEKITQKQKTTKQKIIHGSVAGLVIFTAPLYALGFGLFGYRRMWRISKAIYGISKPSENFLHDHFDKMQKFLATRTKEAAVKSRAYRTHPTFAGLSLISTVLLAFVDPLKIEAFIPFHLLLKINAFVCIVSALAARSLTTTMMGSLDTKKWNFIQGYLSIVSAVLALIPGTFGRLMIHLNWATIFAGGVLERLYVLSVLSQVGATERKAYINWYSPQIKIATLGSIPIAIASFMFSR